ncbi:NAD(P)H-dependent oxidoreductase [Methylomonas sp. UP202]|uniref:NAD(P)H-dependent oxidoreductase n=1 Tax=Methylomonas sp. UP202 TaxID=3040943 RepID=UPI002478E7FD|nr:NAD(P)H-dependent oxidoreductase [Methylomonas sp. UP202]WGS83899.1 NAD(P)H-dependent oxidoreductase [Methylomonas sp. UP202]
MSKNILIVYAHPEPSSVTCQMVEAAADTLEDQGHHVMRSDLYGMKWKAVFDADDFPERANSERLSFVGESAHAYATGNQSSDVIAEQEKLKRADAVLLLFPLWWFGVPAILKGWIERVYAFGFGYGFKDGTNQHRYGEGLLKGKRALVCVMTGGPEADYGPRGINGPIEELLFPLTHGALFYPGMDVLPTHTVYGAAHFKTQMEVDQAKTVWCDRVNGLFTDTPIAYRRQNSGDYNGRQTLNAHLAPGQKGLSIHVAQ